MKRYFIDELKAGSLVEDVFVLSAKHLYQKKDGNNYLNITLADKTGRINGVVWDNVDQIHTAVQTGDFVHAKGNISEYKGMLQFVAKKLSPCPRESVDPADFIPASNRNVDQMVDRLKSLTDSVADEDLQRLFAAFWNDTDLVEQFRREGTRPHAGGVGLDNADYPVDVLGAHTAAAAGIAGHGVRRGNEGVSAVIDIQMRTLGAFEQDLFS